LERAAFVSCISHWHRAFYDEQCPGSAGRGEIVRCGVATPDIGEIAPKPQVASRLLVVARLVKKKGIDILLRATALLPIPVELTVAGAGPEMKALSSLAAELGITERVKFLGASIRSRCRNC